MSKKKFYIKKITVFLKDEKITDRSILIYRYIYMFFGQLLIRQLIF